MSAVPILIIMLQSLSLNSIMKEGTDLRYRIICEDIPSCQKWLPDIIAAMRDGRCMMMTYQSFTKEAPSTFEISPYCLKYFKQRWYILARTEIFPEGYDPKDTFRKLYGVILDKGPVETVIIRVEESQVTDIQISDTGSCRLLISVVKFYRKECMPRFSARSGFAKRLQKNCARLSGCITT